MTPHDLIVVISIRVGAKKGAKAHTFTTFFISISGFLQGFVDFFLARELIISEARLDWKPKGFTQSVIFGFFDSSDFFSSSVGGIGGGLGGVLFGVP